MSEKGTSISQKRAAAEAGFERRYAGLNASQKKAVDAIDGPVLVLAGPGSGKTEILSLRVANILRQTDAAPSNILCLTFTDAAAANMRSRLAGLIGAAAYKVAIHTFHGLCGEIIGRYPEHFFGGASVAPADDVVRMDVMRSIFDALAFDHPLRSFHPEQGFTYLDAALSAIGDIKKGGMSVDEYRAAMEHNGRWLPKLDAIINKAFADRIGKGTVDKVRTALADVEALLPGLAKDPFPLRHQRSIVEALVAELSGVIARSDEEGTTEAVKRFKQSRTKKADDGSLILADSHRHPKMLALADIYAAYSAELYRRGCYDFDDMLLDCVRGIEAESSLRYELQERYQYVLVDEFQDTNDAQMRLVRAIADAPVHEGRPNVMAVGDDDQAIYRFQGADVSNVLDFSTMFRDPVVVTMTENYRSSQAILDVARAVVLRGEDRLERALKGLSKELVARGEHAGHTDDAALSYRTHDTSAHEYAAVSKEIARRIKAGVDPDSIAVISRKHAVLEQALPYLRAEGIPLRYERRQDVLDEPHVAQLVMLARFVVTQEDALLPEILCYPFWGLKREQVWAVSVAARKEYVPWLEAMRRSEDDQVKAIAGFLIECVQHAMYEPAERMLDLLIGGHVRLVEDEDESLAKEEAPSSTYVSPFRSHYFKDAGKPDVSYLTFLSGLRVFVGAVREHQGGALAKLSDVVRFVEIHKEHSIPLLDQSPFVGAGSAVTLLSAHKAKGLEYDTVFVLSCSDEGWTGRGRGRLLSFPMNMPLSPESDTLDDQMRLLYVALTRARRELHLSAHMTSDTGKALSPLRFLVPGEGASDVALKALQDRLKHDSGDAGASIDALVSPLAAAHAAPFLGSEQAMLKELVRDYAMSVTHLNNFLDLTKGGPQAFLEQNLLRFPQARSGVAAYGTAVHAALERVFSLWRRDGTLPGIEQLLEHFEDALRRERLVESDHIFFRDKGRAALSAYYAASSPTWAATDMVEANFARQGVTVGDADLTGKIDRIVKLAGGAMEVRDVKTGRAFRDWESGKTDHDEVRLRAYRRQLVFYKLLVENARDFDGATVTRGMLEFVEPASDGSIVTLPLEITEAETERLIGLIQAVHKKICDLDFPDVSGYPDDVSGIEAFEDDLLAGTI